MLVASDHNEKLLAANLGRLQLGVHHSYTVNLRSEVAPQRCLLS